MTFTVEPTADLPDVWVITPRVFPDERGEFFESWRSDRFADIGIDTEFVQDNHSVSSGGVLRGLHYQVPPSAQAKLVRVASGRVFDVAVDIRRSSSTFGQWTGIELSDDNHRMLWLPAGFAHGFLALDRSVVVYKTSEVYAPEADRALRWDDPDIGIAWPAVESGPHLSPKDAAAPGLAEADVFP